MFFLSNLGYYCYQQSFLISTALAYSAPLDSGLSGRSLALRAA